MGAGRARRSAVPMLFSWLDHDGVTRANVLGRLPPFLDANAPANYQKPLGARVAMPVSPSARVEFDAVNVDRDPAHIRRDLYRLHAAGKAPRIDRDWLRVFTSKQFHDRTINQKVYEVFRLGRLSCFPSE